jgi:diacylglycerol O-acyltransferase / wax synthase
MPERLSAIDGSFLRVESATAHMHVAWSATFRVPPGCPRPTLPRLRRHIAARLERVPRFRRRLAYPPPGLGEPFWVDDPEFDVANHVLPLGTLGLELDDHRFELLCDSVLSSPLDRRRPLWEIRLAPRFRDGRCGLVAKIHHALVDGRSAVEVAQLLFDIEPTAVAELPLPWEPPRPPGPARLAARAVAMGAEESLRAARGAARLAGEPRAAASRIGGTLRRAALAAGEDLLRPAPSSTLNARIGPRRTLVRHWLDLEEVRQVRRAAGATVNDVCLAVAAGGLRELALARGEEPRPIKAMVPVDVRSEGETEALGNRISFAFVTLPLDVASGRARLARIRRATEAFKRDGRPAGAEAVLGALGLLPDALRGIAARAVASPRTYNLTISNVPGPSVPLYMLGTELLEAYPVVPIAEGHALSIGIFGYRERLHFGLYADPDALPQVRELPSAMSSSLRELLLPPRVRARGRPQRRPLASGDRIGVLPRGG